MEIIRSRQNETVKRFAALCSDGQRRRQEDVFVCVGHKLLQEAGKSGAEVEMLLWTEALPGYPCKVVSPEVLDYVSPLKNSPGPVFTVRLPKLSCARPRHAIVLENVQDPGNVGTVLRTANALGVDLTVLCGACADPWSPKSVRATMGAIFRQNVVQCGTESLREILDGLPLYGAALTDSARDIRCLPRKEMAIAIGNEGKGLTESLLALCDGQIIIPMQPQAESLNAAVAAAICMWEMVR